MNGINWQDIEIINIETGKPEVNLYNNYKKLNIKQISLSLSHCKKYATANCVILIETI